MATGQTARRKKWTLRYRLQLQTSATDCGGSDLSISLAEQPDTCPTDAGTLPPNTEQQDEVRFEPAAHEVPPSQEATCGAETSDDHLSDQDADHDPGRKTPRVTARKYAIRLEKLPPETQELIGQVQKFFTDNINLQRRASALSKSTMNKAKERILCK